MNEQYFTSLNGYYVKDKEAIHTYDSVAEMKADSKIKEGAYVKTLGYYEVNDGGNAEYIIRTKTNDDVEDNGSIHFTQNNLVAELIYNENINVKVFGAKGDGINDDTLSMQNIINIATNKQIAIKLFVPNGKYLIDKLIIPWNCRGLTIEGINHSSNYSHNDGCSLIIPTNNENPLISVGSAVEESGNVFFNHLNYGFTLKNINLWGYRNEIIPTRTALSLNTCSNVLIDNVKIWGFNKNGIELIDVYDSNINNVDIQRCGTINTYAGIYIQGNISTTNAIRINNSRLELNELSLYCKGTRYNQISLTGTKIEQHSENTGNNVLIEGTGEVAFNGCYLTPANINYLIKITSYVCRTSFNGCIISSGSLGKFIDGSNTNDIVINGCSFTNINFEEAILLGSYGILTNNSFYLYQNDETPYNNMIVAVDRCIIKNNIFQFTDTVINGNIIKLTGSNNIFTENNFGNCSNDFIINDESGKNNKVTGRVYLQTITSEVVNGLGLEYRAGTDLTVTSIINKYDGNILTFYANNYTLILPKAINTPDVITISGNQIQQYLIVQGHLLSLNV